MFYLKNKRQPCWIDLYKRKETKLHPCRPQPVRHPLPFIIIHTNVVLVLKSRIACATTQKNPSTILVYMILNGKGCLTGCGLYGYTLVS